MPFHVAAVSYPAPEQDSSTQLKAPNRTSRRDHLFVDNVRFLSMIGVVALHCITQFWSLASGKETTLAVSALAQLFKFGTIGFFLVSGFLMGDGLSRTDARTYLSHRIRTVFLPWLVWFGLFCFPAFIRAYSLGRVQWTSWRGFLFAIASFLGIRMFSSIYWFVPNLMISLALLLLLKRWLHSPRLGLLFLAISLGYSINLYTQWLPLRHTDAVLGFAFYLWLGIWASQNHSRIQNWISRVPPAVFFIAAFIAYAASVMETRFLLAIGMRDALDTLRLTNQLYSLLAVLSIVSFKNAVWPGIVNVRKGTFCIYLTHPIVLAVVAVLSKPLFRSPFTGIALLFWSSFGACFVFILIYVIAIGLTRWLDRHPALRWTIGNFTTERKLSSHPDAAFASAARA